MSSTKSQYHPCLPKKLLDELRNDSIVTARPSDIFTEPYEQFRIQALSQKSSGEIEVILEDAQPDSSRSALEPRIFQKIDLFVKGQKRTFLHAAAKRADILLAYESIRIGTPIDWKDKDGATALFLACYMVRSTRAVKDALKTASSPIPGSREAEVLNDKFLDEETERHRRIATLLVEQHADVNVFVDGEGPLSVAAEAACWPLVELLIRHGAKIPSVGQNDYPTFRTTTQRSRFQSLVRTTKRANPRPPRPCPCWSGKLLADCHAAAKIPYPNSYLCRCGRGKTQGRCCGKKQFRVVETWNAKEDWIMPVTEREVPVPEDDEFRAGFDRTQDLMSQLTQSTGFDADMLMSRMGDVWQRLLGGLPPDVFDPAFLHTLKSSDFVPRVWAGQLSKVESKKRMDEWNAGVDKYIALGVDRRSVYDIELQTKIGLNGGPLYKRCEGQNCGKTEGRDVEKMKCCGSCKLIVYCSQTCQVNDWPRHKADCKTKSHKEQQLHAQDVMEQFMGMQTREAAGLDVGAVLAGTLDRMRVREEID